MLTKETDGLYTECEVAHMLGLKPFQVRELVKNSSIDIVEVSQDLGLTLIPWKGLLQAARLVGRSVDEDQRILSLSDNGTIVADLDKKFGQPTISGTRITTEAIYELHDAGESVADIARDYDLTEQQVTEAIEWEMR